LASLRNLTAEPEVNYSPKGTAVVSASIANNESYGCAGSGIGRISYASCEFSRRGLSLLIRFHPLASDMREVVSAMKVSTNLESVADRSVTIARRAKHLNNRPAVRELTLLEPAYRLAVAIFRDSLRAFADGDYELARTLKLKEKELDALTRDLSEKLVARAIVDSELVPSYLDLIFVARALERIGDHAINIAEDSFWRDQAADIRHTYGPKKED
jgi:phosphate transport system protein